MTTIHAQLVAFEQDLLNYITYVFKNLDNAPFGHNYIMCKRFPNWQSGPINLGDSGFLTYDVVESGRDTWYDKNTGQNIPYNYSDIIFISFTKDKNIDTSKEIIL